MFGQIPGYSVDAMMSTTPNEMAHRIGNNSSPISKSAVMERRDFQSVGVLEQPYSLGKGRTGGCIRSLGTAHRYSVAKEVLV